MSDGRWMVAPLSRICLHVSTWSSSSTPPDSGSSLGSVALQTVKGVWDGLVIAYIIAPALLLYEISDEAGAFGALTGPDREVPGPWKQALGPA